jgi:hypothetical protein
MMSTTCPDHRTGSQAVPLPTAHNSRAHPHPEGVPNIENGGKEIRLAHPVAAGVESALNSHHHAASILE